MADLYYQPRATQYQSQYVPMPLDFMQKALESKQAKWDATQLAMDQLSDKEFNALQGEDTKKAQAVKQKIQDFVDASVGRDIGSSEFAREFTTLEREIKNDKDLASVQAAYDKQQELLAMKKKWIMDGKTLESMPEVFYEADRRLKEYIQGKGYKGDVRLYGIEDIRPGVDIQKTTSAWFDGVAKESYTNPTSWGRSAQRMNTEARNLFDAWLSDPSGQQYLRRLDAQNQQWTGSIADMSRVKDETLTYYDPQTDTMKTRVDSQGNPILVSEYDKYQMNKEQKAYDFFRSVAAQKAGVKLEDAKDNQDRDATGQTYSASGGTNFHSSSSEAPVEQVHDQTKMLKDHIAIGDRIKELEAMPNRTTLQDEDLENLKIRKDELYHQNKNAIARVNQAKANYAVETNLVESSGEYNEIKNVKNKTLKEGKHKDELNKDLDYVFTPEETKELYRKINEEIDKEPNARTRARLKNLILEYAREGSFTKDMASLFEVQGFLMDQGFANIPVLGNIMYESEKHLLKATGIGAFEVGDEMGTQKVLDKTNQLDAFYERGSNEWTYNENTSYGEGFGTQVAKGEQSVWRTNMLLQKASGGINSMLEKGLPAEQENELLKKFRDIVLNDPTTIAALKTESEDQARQDDPKRKMISEFENVMNDLIDIKGNLTFEELKDKRTEYDDVAKSVRLDRDLEIKMKNDDGKFTDDYKTTFNETVVQSSVQNAETLYEDETKYLDSVFPPNQVLNRMSVRDMNGMPVTEEYLLNDVFRGKVPESATISIEKTNWDSRFLSRDKDGNFRYNGSLDIVATWTDADGESQEIKQESDAFVFNTAGTVNSDQIKNELIGIKTRSTEAFNQKYDAEIQSATTAQQKISAIEKKISKENENILEISMLTNPSFYRQMSNITKTFDVDGFYKKDADGNIKPTTIPSLNIRRRVKTGEDAQGDSIYDIATDTFKIERIEEGKNAGMFNVVFTTVFNGEVTEKTLPDPYRNPNAAMNILYNYQLEVQEYESLLKLNEQKEAFDAEESVIDVADEFDRN